MKKIKRVVLVQPNMKWMDWNWKTSWDIHPLNLCLLGAMIKEDYEVVIVDDIYATGGTMQAAETLCKKVGYEITDQLCLIDIGIVEQHEVKCLINY